MNQYDKDNLNFLMSLKTEDDWQDWARYCDEDDFRYAMELLKTAQAELLVREMELSSQGESNQCRD